MLQAAYIVTSQIGICLENLPSGNNTGHTFLHNGNYVNNA